MGADLPNMSLCLLRRVSQKWLLTDWSCSQKAPLWGNPHFPHFLNLPCADFWSAKCIKRVSHLFKNGVFKDFTDFHCSTRLYLYVQLRLAATSQFPALIVGERDLPLELLLTSNTANKLISFYYSALMRIPAEVRAPARAK